MRSLQFCNSHFAHFLVFFNYKIHETCPALYITKSKSRDFDNTPLICSFCVYVHMYTYACIWDGQCIHECDTSVWKAENNLRYWSLGIGLWVLVLRWWSSNIDLWVLILGYWSLGIGPQVLVIGCQSSGVGPQVLVLVWYRTLSWFSAEYAMLL